MVAMTTLKSGTVLYHGTDCDDFEEADDALHGPAWLTTSLSVARHFATRSGGWGGRKRIVSYRLVEDLELYEIRTKGDIDELADEHDLVMVGVEGMRESVEASGIPGWIVPTNYPDGDDILISDTSRLEYIDTADC